MAAEAVTRVVLRCEKAQEDKHLDLSSCLLEAVPQAVYHLMRHTELVSCDLSDNALTVMSKKLPINFPQVTVMNVSHNKIEKIPEEINLMTVLESFTASHNKLTALPESFYQLPTLTKLDLSHNDITDLDAAKLCKMPAIREINLEHNPIPGDVYSELQELSRDLGVEVLMSEPDVSQFEDVD
ncbi:leucine-rich repeat-containing protein 20-like [Diadema antillarum]|uniref:leucine-rich repeat-containing protein 20-like n=1 Tax=Diadema antillarum TaxID=105358 RepID=UPI003A88EA70